MCLGISHALLVVLVVRFLPNDVICLTLLLYLTWRRGIHFQSSYVLFLVYHNSWFAGEKGAEKCWEVVLKIRLSAYLPAFFNWCVFDFYNRAECPCPELSRNLLYLLFWIELIFAICIAYFWLPILESVRVIFQPIVSSFFTKWSEQ